MLHTFSTDSEEKKKHLTETLRSLMSKWHAGILEKQRCARTTARTRAGGGARRRFRVCDFGINYYCFALCRETEEVKEQFRGVTFKILFTVPVHSSTEKEFIVRSPHPPHPPHLLMASYWVQAYVVELRMESGSATIIKRYRQFLSLHKKVYIPSVLLHSSQAKEMILL
jgi:hypothetical protein